MLRRLSIILFGADPRLRRLLGYWAGAALVYLAGLGVLQLQVRAGTASPHGAHLLSMFAICGILVFLLMVRFSALLRVSPSQLAVMQALFAFGCILGAYIVNGPVRGAVLTIMLVVMVFCTFSLRPRATLGLCATAIVSLGVTLALLARLDPRAFPPHVELMHFALGAISMLAVTLLTGEMSKLRQSLKQQKQELMEAVVKIRTLATIDELTCLANRRYMNEVLSTEERRHDTPGESVCIALLDIDFFKQVNDRHGHDCGDEVLRTFAAAARAELRAADMLARWGGEEFLLMLPRTSAAEAELVLQRMAARVAAIKIPQLAQQRALTFSAGLVERADGEPFADTISRADKAMYQAKKAGRNRIVAATAPAPRMDRMPADPVASD